MLGKLFGSTVRAKLLKILLLESPGSLHLRELARKAAVSVGNASRELSALAEPGIVTKRSRGSQTYYSINERCPIVPELLAMFAKTAGTAEEASPEQ